MNFRTRRWKSAGLIIGLLSWTLLATADDEFPPPDFGAEIGSLVPSSRHSYIESVYADVPLLHVDPITLLYHYRETTPFLKENAQAQLFYTRHEFEADFKLCDEARLIAVAGYRQTQLEDRPGSLSGYVLGAGLGSPWRRELDWVEWSAVAGGFLSRDNLAANWWADFHLLGRVWKGPEMKMMETTFHPSAGLAADVESVNHDGAFHALYKVGPVLDLLSANDNELRFEVRWYHTDDQPFYQDRDSGLLVGVEVNSTLEDDKLFKARENRPVGWLPLVWGEYDLGYGNSREIERFELDTEVHDYVIHDHRITAVLWYESRQEQRQDDFSNVSYSVAPGIESPIGLESFVSQGQPLVLGTDYEHRSAHALNPDADRVPAGTYLERDSVNIGRLRLQTLGWELPYRDPTMYDRKTAWLNYVDWRATLGYDFHHSRARENPAGQLGLNWDVATVQGHVIYARGLGSIGNEIPDWELECGVRRRRGKIFFRAEDYGLENRLAHGIAVFGGVGFFL